MNTNSRPITVKEYFAREGSTFSNKDAQVIGPVLEQLAQQGGVTARDVLDTARSDNSPLHRYFEWDDRVAADRFRLRQAGELLRSIKIKYMDGTETQVARAFHVEKKEAFSNEPRRYRSFQVLHGESAFAAQMMQMAYGDLQAWRRKYEPYQNVWDNFSSTFAEVINQIGELEGEVVHPNLPAFTDDAVAALLDWKLTFIEAAQTWTAWVEQMKFIIEAIADAEKVFCASQTMKHRDCIRCGKSFISYETWNRVCKSCSSLKSYAADGAAFAGEMV